ncbi:hypothetical protein DFP74_1920 [Nocardiopsis sp. Huas11]|uniref:hypothetical protein n=1 Tax=Nocardiopsis sp. Huas11 TaxID=2183912 RepID=UPI000EACBA34|nr:hypothetical protein [Nocardiopsis sp. Huas11]RKS06292.1 hypothetical protein DFP74_1920 [Nocardiopsis sp. Huas11]
MAHSIHAVLNRALGFLEALLTPARGRHSAAVLRRRRSTRVRRYAPLPAPPAARAPRPAAPLAPPRAHIPADDAALVRGYYRAFEDERDRVQAEAQARLHRWTASVPSGDLLAPDPDDLADLRDATRRWVAQQRRQAVAA